MSELRELTDAELDLVGGGCCAIAKCEPICCEPKCEPKCEPRCEPKCDPCGGIRVLPD
jgi:hypothetical protein